jgi:hypothetical protein
MNPHTIGKIVGGVAARKLRTLTSAEQDALDAAIDAAICGDRAALDRLLEEIAPVCCGVPMAYHPGHGKTQPPSYHCFECRKERTV